MKKTGVELELFTDYEMHLFVERGMRGGISMVSNRYAQANNPQVPGYDPSKPKKIPPLSRRKQSLRMGFKWKLDIPTEEEILNMKENAKKGCILEVDLEYPQELHEEHNSYPLAPEKKAVKKKWMSDYQKGLMKDLDLKPRTARSFC